MITGWIDDDEGLDDLFGHMTLWFDVTDGLDPVRYLRSSQLYLALAEAKVVLDLWVEVIRVTKPQLVLDRTRIAYHRVVTPFELWLESSAARTEWELAVAALVARLAEDLHRTARSCATGLVEDVAHLEAMHQEHLAETLKTRSSLPGSTKHIDETVLAHLIARIKVSRARCVVTSRPAQ